LPWGRPDAERPIGNLLGHREKTKPSLLTKDNSLSCDRILRDIRAAGCGCRTNNSALLHYYVGCGRAPPHLRIAAVNVARPGESRATVPDVAAGVEALRGDISVVERV